MSLVKEEKKQDLLFLSDKKVLLNSPGVLIDDIYYNRLNSTVSLAENTWYMGRLRVALNNKSFNSVSQVLIPNNSLISDVVLHLTLKPLLANQAVNRGWGYSIIKRLTVTYGGSNLPQLAISGDGLFQVVMSEIETSEKKSEYFNLGGQALFTVDQVPEADVQIPLAFSSACGRDKKKPIDSSMLNSPIVITIEFGGPERIYVDNGAVNRGTSFIDAQAYIRTGDFENRNMSLKKDLIRNPKLMYSFPFIRTQSFVTSIFSGQTKAGGSRVSLNLLSFINADIVGMSFAVIDLSFRPGAGIASPTTGSHFNYDPISDVFLEFNGQTLVDLPGQMYKFNNMSSIMGGTSIGDNFYDVNTGFTEANAKAVSTYFVMIDFSRIRAICFQNQLQNVFRIGNQSLTLQFFTSKGGGTNYQLHANYWYNAIIALQDGDSKIMIS